jgi:hypothetical protein
MPTRRARLRRRVYAKLPNWLKNHDFEVFAAVLGPPFWSRLGEQCWS